MKRVFLQKEFSHPEDFRKCSPDEKIYISPDSGEIRLVKTILVIDEEGRFSHKKGEEINQFTWAKKVFHLDRLSTSFAQLIFFAFEYKGNRHPLIIEINGNVLEHPPQEKFQGQYMWFFVDIPPSFLRSGDNEVIFQSENERFDAWILAVENGSHRGRSFKSEDGGKTWRENPKGFDNSLCGEYGVRLRLEQYPSRGVICSPPIDLARGENKPGIGEKLSAITDFKIDFQGEVPEGTEVRLECRFSSGPPLSQNSWSEWKSPEEKFPLPLRFLQWRAELLSSQPHLTPVLKKVKVSAQLEVEEVSPRRLMIKNFPSEPPLLSSYPFYWQNYTEPRLEALRNLERLDRVVKEARTEWEKFILLRRWVSKRLVSIPEADKNLYPPWNSLVIMDWMRKGKGHGGEIPACLGVHYAVVFGQCCLALGLLARMVVLGRFPTLHEDGHFVNEVWSNDCEKWVIMDPRLDVHFEKDGIPLSALEIHQLWKSDRLSEISQVGGETNVNHLLGPDWSWQHLQRGGYRFWGLVLRNDHLSFPYLTPLEHGWVSYHWDGFLWWDDNERPELSQFSHHSHREADFYWDPQKTYIYLQYTEEENVLSVLLDTPMPNLDGFEVRIDRESWKDSPPSFSWPLHRGKNLLEARARNKFGERGKANRVSLAVSWR